MNIKNCYFKFLQDQDKQKKTEQIKDIVMEYHYIIEIENVDTNDKYYHCVESVISDNQYKGISIIDYQAIMDFILLYQPQCNREMLLIMNKHNDQWNLTLPNFQLNLKEIINNHQNNQKNKINQRIKTSKLLTSKSQIQASNISNNHIKPVERQKTILQIRFQCQLWTDQQDPFHQKVLNQSMPSIRDQNNINLAQKVKQLKNKINEIQKFTQQIHKLQADAIGINIFWANPYFATDGIERKQIEYDSQNSQIQLLKNTVKCLPYIDLLVKEVKSSNKKVKLNIDLFNQQSFSLRNIFNVVYLVCHTEVTEVKKQQSEENMTETKKLNNKKKINDKDITENKQSKNQQTKQKQKKENDFFQNLQFFKEQSDQDKSQAKEEVKTKKTKSFQYEDIQKPFLAPIDEQKSSQNMTERKQSCDILLAKDFQESQIVPNQMVKIHSEDRGILQNKYLDNKKLLYSAQKLKQQSPSMFSSGLSVNLQPVLRQQNQGYNRIKLEREQAHINRLSRSNSRKSMPSKGKSIGSKSKSNKAYERKTSLKKISSKIQSSQNHLQNYSQVNIQRSKKHLKKIQRKQRNKQNKKQKKKQQKKEQKKTINYFLGEKTSGQLQKIQPQDLDRMLKQKMLQKVQLFILQTSYPYYHLPVIKKYAKNILLINSNPIYPQKSAFFFLRYFFRYLFDTKNIKIAYEKALIQTVYMYKGQTRFFDIKLANLFQQNKESLQNLKFDEVMQKINEKYINKGTFLCCCYHQHQPLCNFRQNKSAKKYADAHYKFHFNRCDCNFPNLMIHECESKKEVLGKFNVIDKKDYRSEFVYDCCCQGVHMGKYILEKKNKECFNITNDQNNNDPHEMTNKFRLLSGEESKFQKKINQLTEQLITQGQEKNQESQKYELNLEEGSIQNSQIQNIEQALKYLSQNELLGNSKIIAQLLEFFIESNQIKNDLPNMTKSKLQSSKIYSVKQNQTKILSKGLKICNMYGRNSSGRKTIAKYLGYLMVVKKIFQKVSIKSFSTIQDFKNLQTSEHYPVFYILVDKSGKKNQQINYDQIKIQQNFLPSSLKCIIVTNKKINLSISEKEFVHKTPRPLNMDEMQTYIKLYEHLSVQEKKRLEYFVQLTDLERKYHKEITNQENHYHKQIYANEIDPHQIITIIRRSNYEDLKNKFYFQSIEKINPVSFPFYLFITGIIFQTLTHFNQLNNKSTKNQKKHFTETIRKKLTQFMTTNKGFYLQFDPKRNKKLPKKKKNKITQAINNQPQDIKTQLSRISSKQTQNQQEASLKKEIIQLISIEKFYKLLYQKFRKQISLRPLECLKAYIYYTTLQESHKFSVKDVQKYSKEYIHFHNKSLNHYHHDQPQHMTRKVSYQNQFFESTSLNKNSLFSKILSKIQEDYNKEFQNSSSKVLNTKTVPTMHLTQINKLQMSIPNQNQPQKQQEISADKKNQQHHKQALQQFFVSFVESLHPQNITELKKHQSSASYHYSSSSGSHKQFYETHFTPKREINESPKNIKSESLPNKLKRIQTLESKKKDGQKQHLFNFEEDQKHFQFIMSGGLHYLRNTICSHVIYRLLDQDKRLQVLKAGLILINNALILMKTPHFKNEQEQDGKHRLVSYNYDSNEQFSSQSHSFGMNESQRQNTNKNQKQQKKQKNEIQQEIKAPFSVNGMLYLLYKMRVRFDNLLLSINKNEKIQQVRKLNILTELFILQLHLMNLAKGQDYEKKLSRLEKINKVQKYLSQILYNKGKNINYLKEQIIKFKIQKVQQNNLNKNLTQYKDNPNKPYPQSNFDQQEKKIIVNQVLQAYIMILTNHGRKKINQNIRKQIQKLFKLYNHQIKQNSQKNYPNEKHFANLPKIKILKEISQSKTIFNQIKSYFLKLQNEKITDPSIKLIGKKSNNSQFPQFSHKNDSGSNKSYHDLQSQKSKSFKTIQNYHFQDEIQIFKKLLKDWHSYQTNLQRLKPHKLYQFLQNLRLDFTSQDFTFYLRFSSRYINEFYNDLKSKVYNELTLMKQKSIIFFSADPIEFNRHSEGSASKQHLPEYVQNKKQYKTKVQFEGNKRTIILPKDYEKLDLTKNLQLTRKSKHIQVQEFENKQKNRKHGSNSYEHFYLKKKLNESNLKWLSHSLGCKYFCIDTTVGTNDYKQVIGQSEQGQLIILKKQRLAEMINLIQTQVVFICLHNDHLADQIKNISKKKQIVYFNFQNTAKNIKQNLKFSYYRMIARKVVHLILQKIINDDSQFSEMMKLFQSIRYVTHKYQFSIKNKENQTVFRMSNQELIRTVNYIFGQKGQRSCDKQQKDNFNCKQLHTGKVFNIDLQEQNIISEDEVRQVKTILSKKYNTQLESKTINKIQHLKSFDKLYDILQYILQDKYHYEMFEHINLQDFKNTFNKDSLIELKRQKSGQSDMSVPSTMRKNLTSVRNQSNDKRKKDKKSKQSKSQTVVSYKHKWKSQFMVSLLNKNILSWPFSNKNCFLMVSNSDLMNEKTDKYEEWTKTAFEKLFKLDNCDNQEHLHRDVTEIKIDLLQKEDKKSSKSASLFFMQTSHKFLNQ